MAHKSIAKLRKAALALPETEEGVSCNKACFRAGKKNFLFIGEYCDSWDVMLKLGDSAAEAQKLGAKEPGTYGVGGTGWMTATFAPAEGPPAGLFERWIEESYRLIVPKRIVALLPEPARSAPQRGAGTKKKSAAIKKKGATRKKVSAKKKRLGSG